MADVQTTFAEVSWEIVLRTLEADLEGGEAHTCLTLSRRACVLPVSSGGRIRKSSLS